MAEVLRVLINGSFNLGHEVANAGKSSFNSLVKPNDNEKFGNPNEEAFKNNTMWGGVIAVLFVVGFLLLLFGPLIMSIYYAFACNRDIVQALLEFLIVTLVIGSFFPWIGPLIYCYYKSNNCSVKGVKKLSLTKALALK